MVFVAAVYHFAELADPEACRDALLAEAEAAGVRGSLIIAREGINGTIAGSRDGVMAVLNHIKRLPGCADVVWKEATAAAMPFARLKVRLKREIVTMGQPDLDVAATGHYVEPADWNALIAAPDVVVIDTRNDYEVAIGSFDGAVDPSTQTFREFPAWWDENAARFQGKRVAMFCTGGIRCEKSTAYLKSRGVDEVYHLRGGILRYLKEVPEEESRWQGACFVFDERVAVGHQLAEGTFTLCRACGWPLNPQDRQHADYERGVSCHRCRATYSDADRARFRERQRQFDSGAVPRAAAPKPEPAGR